jgi:hypothetical protein
MLSAFHRYDGSVFGRISRVSQHAKAPREQGGNRIFALLLIERF